MDKKLVYVLVDFDEIDLDIVGVFSTSELAEAAKVKYMDSGNIATEDDSIAILTYELDYTD